MRRPTGGVGGGDQLARGSCHRHHSAGALAGEGSFSPRVIQAFAIARSHYDDNINLRAMSLGFAPSYELSELDEIEAAVTPLVESLASKIEDMVLPRRDS